MSEYLSTHGEMIHTLPEEKKSVDLSQISSSNNNEEGADSFSSSSLGMFYIPRDKLVTRETLMIRYVRTAIT